MTAQSIFKAALKYSNEKCRISQVTTIENDANT